jgi:uncharacterized protein
VVILSVIFPDPKNLWEIFMQNWRKFLWAFGLMACGLCVSLQVAAARLDCQQAKSPVEKNLCATLYLRQFDARMSVVYAELWEKAPKTRRSLARAQKAWLAKRDACGESSSCLERAYQERIQALRAQLATLLPDTPDETDQRALAELDAKIKTLQQTNPVFPLENALAAFAVQSGMTYFRNVGGDDGERAQFPVTRPDGVLAEEWRALLASEVEIAVDSALGGVSYTLVDLDGDGLRDLIIDADTGGTGLYSEITLLHRKGARFEYPALEDYFYSIKGRGGNQDNSWIRSQGRVYAAYRDGRYGADTLYLLRPFRQNRKVPVLTVRYRYQFLTPETQYDKDTDKHVTLDESLYKDLTIALSTLNGRNFKPSGMVAEAPVCPVPPDGIEDDYIFGAGHYVIEFVHDFPVWLQKKCHPARLQDWFGSVDEKGELFALLCLKNPPSSEDNCYDIKAKRYAVKVESGIGARRDD